MLLWEKQPAIELAAEMEEVEVSPEIWASFWLHVCVC